MSFLIWIIVGAIAGWVASKITNSQEGLVGDIIVGMVGSILGGIIIELFSGNGLDITRAFTSFNLASILVSILGATVLLLVLKAFKKNT